jgi:hypothetical protein
MKNIIIEGGIDFYAELYKSLDDDDSKNINDINDNNLCLISKQPLTDKFVELECGHKFNYVPLYKDIVNHKLKFNNMEALHGRLKKTQIRCPYCRKIQNKLLPYYDNIPGIKKIEFVNFIDENKTYPADKEYICKINNQYCAHLSQNPQFNNDLPISNTNTQYVKCKIYASKNLLDLEDGQIKWFCCLHFNENKLNIYKIAKEKEKKLKEEAKAKAKEEKIKAREEAKAKAKEEKTKAKEEAKAKAKEEKIKKNENVIISNTNNLTVAETEPLMCVQIIKSGTKKGTHCGLKTVCNNLCKRHYNLSIL